MLDPIEGNHYIWVLSRQVSENHNFLNGRTFSDLSDLNTQGLHWLESVAHTRIHATTGERPAVLLESERAHLTPLGQVAPYQLTLKDSRVVDTSGFVRYRGSRYSVPPAHVGSTVLVEEGATQLRIRSGDLIIAEHKLAPSPGACISQREHIEQLWRLGRPNRSLTGRSLLSGRSRRQRYRSTRRRRNERQL